MALQLHLYRRQDGVTVGEIKLLPTTTAVASKLVPTWSAHGLEPTLEGYIAWVTASDTFVPPLVYGLEAQLRRQRGNGASLGELQATQVEIQRLTTSPNQLHLDGLRRQIFSLEVHTPKAAWFWQAQN